MTIACCSKCFFAFVLAQYCLFSTSYSLGEDASRTKVDENKSVKRNLRTGTLDNIFQKNSGLETLVVGGQTAIWNRHPYFAYLKTGVRICGGSLIAPDLILTAASCRDMERAQVGRNDLYSFDDEYDSLDIIEEFVHPSYDPSDTSKRFDILLLKLSGRSNNTLLSLNFDPAVPSQQGQRLTVAGFGYTDNAETLPSRLQSANLDYFPNDICSTKSTAEFSMSDKITTDMLCAGADGKGVCSGDSGGPLLILGNSAEQDILVGTLSWGAEPCGELPGVFQRMSESSMWIKETVCAKSIDVPPGYCPSPAPSASPAPSVSPSIAPSSDPSSQPSSIPSDIPSLVPSSGPSDMPSIVPSSGPSSQPSSIPSDMPSLVPSSGPSSQPSSIPSGMPSDAPSRLPSQSPSVMPSDTPTNVPSQIPSISVAPSSSPSSLPSGSPSLVPTISNFPTQSPTMSSAPSEAPSVVPSASPTDEPTKPETTMPSMGVAPTFSPIERTINSQESKVKVDDSAWSMAGHLSVFRYTSVVVLAAALLMIRKNRRLKLIQLGRWLGTFLYFGTRQRLS